MTDGKSLMYIKQEEQCGARMLQYLEAPQTRQEVNWIWNYRLFEHIVDIIVEPLIEITGDST